jgi:DNA-binding transcriptional ArsR family regulator
MYPFNVLGDPIRRRILELLAEVEQAAGDIAAIVQREFHLSQLAVSAQLKVLRDNGRAPSGGRQNEGSAGGRDSNRRQYRPLPVYTGSWRA